MGQKISITLFIFMPVALVWAQTPLNMRIWKLQDGRKIEASSRFEMSDDNQRVYVWLPGEDPKLGRINWFTYADLCQEDQAEIQAAIQRRLAESHKEVGTTTVSPSPTSFDWESDLRKNEGQTATPAVSPSPKPGIYLFWYVVFAATVVCIFMSFGMDKKLKKRLPHTRPYKWGFFVGCICVASGVVLFSACLFFPIEPWQTAFVMGCCCVFTVTGHSIIKRKKWAWVVGTILTMNPIGWMINGAYAAKRWREFTAEAAGGTSGVGRASGEAEHHEGQAAILQESESYAKVANGHRNGAIEYVPPVVAEECAMGEITITCPRCKQPLESHESFVGKEISCPKCDKKFVVSPVAQEPTLAIEDESLYARAMEEIEKGTTAKGTWAKAFTESMGDQNSAKALYIKYRVRQLVGSKEV